MESKQKENYQELKPIIKDNEVFMDVVKAVINGDMIKSPK